jgi:hypothetical protein
MAPATPPGKPWQTYSHTDAHSTTPSPTQASHTDWAIAWGNGLNPATGTEIALCTPDTLTEAIRQIII